MDRTRSAQLLRRFAHWLIRKWRLSEIHKARPFVQNPNFVYDPLDLSLKTIRVVRVLPGKDPAPVECLIKHITLREDHACLSYCCGPDSKNMVMLNGKDFKVKDNLYSFLLYVRKKGIFDWLWIDAISINENCITERNHQIRQMADIYSKASHVWMWLGKDETLGTPQTKFKQEKFQLVLERAIGDVSKPARTSDDTWASLYYLCLASYFDRMWIIQEVLLAKKVTVLWYDLRISWENLNEFVKAVLDNGRPDSHTLGEVVEVADDSKWTATDRDLLWPPVRRLEAMHQAVYCDLGKAERGLERSPKSQSECYNVLRRVDGLREARGSLGGDLHSSVRAFGPWKCGKVRDRVYALLSLVKNGQEFLIDENEDLPTIYWRLLDFGRDYGRPGLYLPEINYAGDFARHLTSEHEKLTSSDIEKSVRQRSRLPHNHSEIGFLVKSRIARGKLFPVWPNREVPQFDIWYVGSQTSYVRSHGSDLISVPAEIECASFSAACSKCSAALGKTAWKQLGAVEKSIVGVWGKSGSTWAQGLPEKRETQVDSLRALKFGTSSKYGLRADFESRPLQQDVWLLGMFFDNTGSTIPLAFLPLCESRPCFQSDLISHIESGSRYSIDKPSWMDDCQIPYETGTSMN